jgi:hypothetical protein
MIGIHFIGAFSSLRDLILLTREARELTMEDLIERRKLPRMNVRWPVTLYTAAGELLGEIRDVTSSGAYVQCSERLNLNETYWLQIRVPHHDLMLKGKVIWSNLVIDRTGKEVSHTGISFIQIEDEDRQVLKDVILGSGE